MKVFLVILATLFGIGLVVALIGYVLWAKYGEEYTAEIIKAIDQGVQVGLSSDDRHCYETTVEMLQDCEELKCTVYIKTYAMSCLQNVRVKTDLCDSVPRINNFLDYLSWTDDICEELAPDNSGCSQVMEEVLNYCALQ